MASYSSSASRSARPGCLSIWPVEEARRRKAGRPSSATMPTIGVGSRVSPIQEIPAKPGPTSAPIVLGVDQLSAIFLEAGERSSLIRTHHPAITGNIGGDYSGEFAPDLIRSHLGFP